MSITVITNIGRARLTNAIVLGEALHLTTIKLCSTAIMPVVTMSALPDVVWTGAITSLDVDPDDAAQLIARVSVPVEAGTWTVRGAGLFDANNNMIAVGSLAAVDKVAGAVGMTITMVIAVGSQEAAVIALLPSGPYLSTAEKGVPGGLATLDPSGKVPTNQLQHAIDYADDLVIGLLDDRGNHDASSSLFPESGGSGAAGAIKKGDIWRISVAGTLGETDVAEGDWVRALADAPGQTAGNWAINHASGAGGGTAPSAPLDWDLSPVASPATLGATPPEVTGAILPDITDGKDARVQLPATDYVLGAAQLGGRLIASGKWWAVWRPNALEGSPIVANNGVAVSAPGFSGVLLLTEDGLAVQVDSGTPVVIDADFIAGESALIEWDGETGEFTVTTPHDSVLAFIAPDMAASPAMSVVLAIYGGAGDAVSARLSVDPADLDSHVPAEGHLPWVGLADPGLPEGVQNGRALRVISAGFHLGVAYAVGEGALVVDADAGEVIPWLLPVEPEPVPETTDDLPEGDLNLYHTDARALAAVMASMEWSDAMTQIGSAQLTANDAYSLASDAMSGLSGKLNAGSTTSAIVEGSNLYFTSARVRSVTLDGLNLAVTSAITAADSVLSALGKLQAQVTAKPDVAAVLSAVPAPPWSAFPVGAMAWDASKGIIRRLNSDKTHWLPIGSWVAFSGPCTDSVDISEGPGSWHVLKAIAINRYDIGARGRIRVFAAIRGDAGVSKTVSIIHNDGTTSTLGCELFARDVAGKKFAIERSSFKGPSGLGEDYGMYWSLPADESSDPVGEYTGSPDIYADAAPSHITIMGQFGGSGSGEKIYLDYLHIEVVPGY